MLELKDISFRIRDGESEKNILNNVNLVFDDNMIYAVTGPNGGGKSVLAKIIMGIEQPSTGSIIFNGRDITQTDVTERARLGIGYAFQHPPKFKGIRVRDILEMASADKDANVCEYLYQVGLCSQDYLDREVDSRLSGGELKRIEMATVLAMNLKVSIFDEPEAGIDLWSFKKLAESFKNLHRESNSTIVVISHQERIIDMADSVYLVSDGSVKEIDAKRFLESIKRNESCECSTNCERGLVRDAECTG